jgi:exopolyphosphatase / guanosine-5'-triphosphate,3'-diphosphate pyrophosphatase
VPGRLAVADLGSNSFRLVVFTDHGDWWKRTDEIYEPVRIGEGLTASGRLGEEPMRRALATTDVFAHFCRATGLGPEDIRALATSAIRDAANGAEFVRLARRHSGLDVQVLSPDEEARYGYLAAVNSTTLADGAVLDLGGGSLQLVRLDGRLATESGSWPLGSVRMTERFLPGSGPAKPKALKELRGHVKEVLASVRWLRKSGRRLVGIGGTVRNLAQAADAAAGFDVAGVQGAPVTREALEELIERLAALPAAERSAIAGIKPARADIILAGACVIAAVLDAGGFDALEATEAGLREGVFFEHYLADADPPLFEDVRRASVLNLAAQYRFEPAHTEHVAKLALGMFDELAEAGLHEGDPIERELLWASCMLHDVGMAVDYDDHHKHGRYLILNAGLPGFAPSEVALIAQATRYHRKGMPSPGPLAPLLASEEDQRRLDRCAVLLRLGEDLERSRDQLVRSTHVELQNGSVDLRLDAPGDGVAVPRWAAARETELFARAFGRTLTVSEGPS